MSAYMHPATARALLGMSRGYWQLRRCGFTGGRRQRQVERCGGEAVTPELLELLQRLVRFARTMDLSGRPYEPDHPVTLAEEQIAKAAGGAQ